MEGNTIARQKEAARLGVKSSSAIYVEAIKAHFPTLEIDAVNAADKGQSLPHGCAFSDYDGLVIGGSGLHAYDSSFEVRNQIDLLRAFTEGGRPVLGSCWGLQIAAIASGGTVGLSPKGREIGFARQIVLSRAGRGHPYFAEKGPCFDAPCIHYDEVQSLPVDAVVLCSNAHSKVQGAVVPVGKSEVWAVQYHPEYDLEHIAMLLGLYEQDMLAEDFFQTSADLKAYQQKLRDLGANTTDKGLAWQMGIGRDILYDRMRRAEIINWVRAQIYNGRD